MYQQPIHSALWGRKKKMDVKKLPSFVVLISDLAVTPWLLFRPNTLAQFKKQSPSAGEARGRRELCGGD